jgi:MYXO-CTERM domain-containing protein
MALGVDVECTEDLECLSLFCADPGDGRRRCLTPCRGGDGICLGGEACAATIGSCGGCVDADILAAARGLGEPCDTDEACGSGACLSEGGLSYCTRECATDPDCGSGDRFHCRGGTCVRGPLGGIGDGCIENGDCRDDYFCATRRGVSWCTDFCSADAPCPEGYECTEVGEGTSVCAPARGVVGDVCVDGESCISGLCSDAGTCTRECSSDAPCSGAFECLRTDDGASAMCTPPASMPTPPPEGGCSTSGAPAPTGALWAAAALLLILSRRRRL